MPLPIPRFDAPPLYYRSYTRADLDRLEGLLTDAATMGPVGGPLRRDEIAGMLERYLATHDPRYLVVFGAFRAEGDAYVGSGRIFVSEAEPDAPEIGYLVRATEWGHGLGTHIARALVRIARERLGAERVVARVLPTNPASARVLEKAGFIKQRERVTDHGVEHVYLARS